MRKTLLLLALLAPGAAHAIEIKISVQALERTLAQQLFTGPQGRYYIRGDEHSPCFVYADNPKVTFVQDRIVVHVHTHSRLGTRVGATCLGVGLSPKPTSPSSPTRRAKTSASATPA